MSILADLARRDREQAAVLLRELERAKSNGIEPRMPWRPDSRVRYKHPFDRIRRVRRSSKLDPEVLAAIRAGTARCYLCATLIALDELEIDHVIPVSRGGTNDGSNLLPTHDSCNGSKSDRIVAFDVSTRQPLFSRRGFPWCRS